MNAFLNKIWKSNETRQVRKEKAGRKGQKVHLEVLEPRVLLSADFAPEAAAALATGIDQLGDRVDAFLTSENLLDQHIPLLLQVAEDSEGEVEERAPSINDLFTVPVDVNGDGYINRDWNFDDDGEATLQALDTRGTGGSLDPDGLVDLGEFLEGWLYSKIENHLNGVQPGDSTLAFEEFVLGDGLFVLGLDRTLDFTSLADASIETIAFTIDSFTDMTENPDAEYTFDIDFTLDITRELALDLGLEAEALKLLAFTGDALSNPQPPVVLVTSSMTFGFEFGVFTGGQPPEDIDGSDFLVRRADTLTVSTTVDDNDIDFNLNIGFLGAEVVNGQLDLQADVEVTLLDPNDPGILGFDDSQYGVENTDGTVSAAAPTATELTTDSGFFLRIGNIGVTTPITVGAGDYTDFDGVRDAVETALGSELGSLLNVSLVGAGSDTLQLELVDTTSGALGFEDELVSTAGELLTPSPTIFEYLTEQIFLLSLAGALPRLVVVRFEDLGFDDNQSSDLEDDLVAEDPVLTPDLPDDATIDITVTREDGTTASQSILITDEETDGFTTAAELAAILDGKLNTTLAALLDVSAGDDDRIVISAASSNVGAISIWADANAVAQMGFASSPFVAPRMTAASDATSDLSGPCKFDIVINGLPAVTVEVPDNNRANFNDLLTDINQALTDEGITDIQASMDDSRVVLEATDPSVGSFDFSIVGNESIGDLVDDVNAALAAAGFDTVDEVHAVAVGDQLRIESVGASDGQSLEISRTLTFDAGVTYGELTDATDAELFESQNGALSHVEMDLPVSVLSGLVDGNGDPWDPADVAIVGNFNPFDVTVATYEDVSRYRFNIDYDVYPDDPADPASENLDPTDLEDEVRLVNFAELLQFNAINSEGMIKLLTQLGQTLDQLVTSGELADTGVPFTAITLADLFTMNQLFQTGLVYDPGPDGKINSDKNISNEAGTDDHSRLLVRTFINGDDNDAIAFLPSFATAQQLATELSDLLQLPLGSVNATYNPVDGDDTGNELSYTISFVSNDDISLNGDVPFEFNLDLDPFNELTIDTPVPTEAKVSLTGRNVMEMTFGIDLDPAVPISLDTEISKLNGETGVGIKTEHAITGAESLEALYGLESETTFKVRLGSDAAVTVSIPKFVYDPTGLDGSIGDFVDQVQAAFDSALGAGEVTISHTAENALVLTSAETITLIPVQSDPAALTELGFARPEDAETPLSGTPIKAIRPAELYALTADAHFTIEITSTFLSNINTATEVVIKAADTANNGNASALLGDVNNALRLAGLQRMEDGSIIGIKAGLDANRLVLTATDDSTQFTLYDLNAAAHDELGLRAGTADTDDLVVVDRSGDSHGISLDALLADPDSDVSDLLDLINTQLGVTVTATLNGGSTGLLLTDNIVDPVSTSILTVGTVNGSLAAVRLGLVNGPTNPDDLNTADDNATAGEPARNPDFVDGSSIGTKSLVDSFFVRDGSMSAAFLGTLPLAGIDGIAGDALVGIVGVDVWLSGGFGGVVTVDLKAPGEFNAPGSKVSLTQLQAGVGDTEVSSRVATEPVISKQQTLNYETGNIFDTFDGATPGTVLTTGTADATAIILEHDYSLGGGTLYLIGVEGTFDDADTLVSSTGDTATADGNAQTADFYGDLDLDFAVKGGFSETEGYGQGISDALQGLTGTVEVHLTSLENASLADVSTQLDDLYEFVDLGYLDLGDALEELESLVLSLESNFELLNQALPLINKSVSELLGISSGFSTAVDNFIAEVENAEDLLDPAETDIPTLTLQGMAKALRGAFGLEENSSAIIVDLVQDGGGILLTIDFDLVEAVSSTVGLDAELGGDLPNLTSGKILEVIGSFGFNFKIGIDLDDPTRVFLFNPDGGLDVDLSVIGDGAEDLGLVFQAMIGELPVQVRDGMVDMDVEFSLGGLDFSGETLNPGRKLLGDVIDSIAADPDFTDGLGPFTADILSQDFLFSIPLFDPAAGLTGFLTEIYAEGTDLLDTAFSLLDTTALEDLTGQIEDLVAALDEFNPLDNLLLMADYIDFFLEGLQDFFDLDLFNLNLPIVGTNLSDGVRFIEDFRTNFVNTIRNYVEQSTDIVATEIETLIEGFFNALPGFDPVDVITSEVLNGEGLPESYQWDFDLGGTLTIPFDLDFDIGIPLLGMDVDIPLNIIVDWGIDFGFGVNQTQGAYFDVSAEDELSLDVTIELPPGESFDGRLGFLQLIVENNGSGVTFGFGADFSNGAGGGKLGFSDLGSLEFDPSFHGGKLDGNDHVLDFSLTVGVSSGPTVFPNITTGFLLDWNVAETALADLSADILKDGLTLVQMTDISLDVGSFLNDFLGDVIGEIAKFTEPFDEVIDALTTPVPVVSQLAGQDITLLDIAGWVGEVDTSYIDWIENILNVIDIINGLNDQTSLAIKLTDGVTLFDASNAAMGVASDTLFNSDLKLADAFDTSTLGSSLLSAVDTFANALTNTTIEDIDPQQKADKEEIKNTMGDLTSGSFSDLLSFPFLDNPMEIVGLLFGHHTSLIELNAPPLTVGFDWEQSFPIYPPLYGVVGFGFEFGIDVGFGFDTYGIERFAKSDFTNPALIFDGFYLMDEPGPELYFSFNLAVGAELSLLIASAGVKLQGTATIGFDWFDPNEDSRVHLSELINTLEHEFRNDNPLAPLTIFDLTGELILELLAYLSIDFGLFEVEYEFPILPEITLFTFEYDFNRTPILATDLGNGTLQLNMGPNAIDRLNGDTSDGSEAFEVTYDNGDILVASSSLGVSAQRYSGNFTNIVGLGGQGDDSITLTGFDTSNIQFYLDGGVGNDTIQFVENLGATPATGAGAVIIGGLGNDTLTGSHLDDQIWGGVGNDVIYGGRGYDMLFGDDGQFGVTAGAQYFVAQRINANDGDDEIHGGADDDIIIGGGGSDDISGDAGRDVVLGDGGRFIYTKTGGHIDVSSLASGYLMSADGGPFTPNDKSDPNPATTTSEKIEAIYESLIANFSATDLGLGGNDTIAGGDDADILFGGSGNDTMAGDGGDDYAVGGLGFDTIDGGADNDALFGNAQNDTINGNGGSDLISGGFGDDVLHGNAGDDYMVGGRGLDVMYGDEDDDEVFGEGEPDVLFGGADDDLVVGGVGADIMFGDDGLVAKLDSGGPSADEVIVGMGNQTLLNAYRSGVDSLPGSLDLILTDVQATDGNDFLSGGGSGDVMLGGGDDIMGGDVDPRLAIANTPLVTTETGDDVLFGDGGVVEFYERRLQRIASVYEDDPTGSYDDTIYGDNGDDIIIGGRGSDSNTYSGTNSLGFDRILAGGHGPGRGETDPGVSDEDIIIGDNGELIYHDDSIAANFGKLRLVQTMDTADETGGADTVYGELGDDIILGGVNGSVDVLYGNAGDDVILGDNGLLNYAFDGDTDLTTLDLVQSFIDGLGGEDHIYGNAGEDVILGGTGGDEIYGDDDTASAGALDGQDIILGDNGIIRLKGVDGRLMIRGTAVKFIHTSDEENATGGDDTISGNAMGDVILGGVNGIDTTQEDVIYGDAAVTGAHDGNDVILGDNGLLHFAFDGDTDQNSLDIVATRPYAVDEDSILDETFTLLAGQVLVGGNDTISGDVGADNIFGGVGDDTIYGDNATISNGADDGEDIILGDNGQVLLNGTGPSRLQILDSHVRFIETTDTTNASGGIDAIEGNAKGDVILGGADRDTIYGDREETTSTSIGYDGNDVILGDNGQLDFAYGNANLTTLDLVRSYPGAVGGSDTISGNKGGDLVIGGTAGDTIYGDNLGATANAADLGDILIGDNADVFTAGPFGGPALLNVLGTGVSLITTTDTTEATGGSDTIEGNANDDVIIGGVAGDILYGDAATPKNALDGDDVILGDNGELDFAGDLTLNLTPAATFDLTTLDRVETFLDALGGNDVISGNAGADMAMGGTADDTMYGDNAGATGAGTDGNDILLGDNGIALLVPPYLDETADGSDRILVLGGAMAHLRSTDDGVGLFDADHTAGSDTIEGNAGGDIILGGSHGDFLYGDRASVTTATNALDGDDIILGDNGALEWLSTGRLDEIEGIDVSEENPDLHNWFTDEFDAPVRDANLDTLDLITTEQPNNGGRDLIYGDNGSDILLGGTDADTIYGDTNGAVDPNTVANDLMFGDHGRLYPQFSRTLVGGSLEPLADVNGRNFFAIDIGQLDGGEGDRMWGEEGKDIMLGQQGDDRMWGGSDDDDMTGGHNVSGGVDELDTTDISADLSPDISTPAIDSVNDLMDGGSGDDAMAGDNAIVWRRGDDISPRFRMLTQDAIYTTTNSTITTNVLIGVVDSEAATTIDTAAQSDPADAVGRDIRLLDHADNTASDLYGADVMAGGADSDVMFGQLANDLMQGDGSIGTAPDAGPNTQAILVTDDGIPDTGETLYFNIPEAVSDGDDYLEGGGGGDLMYGGLGQDDIIGGSSALFGLITEEMRPDGSDAIFGGAGIDIARNDIGDATEDLETGVITTVAGGHVRDADFIMGDNANVYRLVEGGADGTVPDDPSDNFLTFNYDTYEADADPNTYDRIIPRAMVQLDYTLGGADFAGGAYTAWGAANDDNGAADLIHGESGDDVIFGMTGSDVIFGEGQDDDIVGGYGHDWISGGTGRDGVLGDDGLVLTSRNSTAGEPLYGIAGLESKDSRPKYADGNVLNEVIYTPGSIQYALINVEGQLKKTADLVPFSLDPTWIGNDDEFPDDQSTTPYADDIIFGGLGSDWLHGGSGDDAISGAEALAHAYVPTYDEYGDPAGGVLDLGYEAVGLPVEINPGDVLAFNPLDEDGRHLNNRFRPGEFDLYDEYDPRRIILLTPEGDLYKGTGGTEGVDYFPFLLNFNKDEGVLRPGGTVPKATGQQTEEYGPVHDDGGDALFGDNGNDWLVGGTGADDMYGGWGNDLLNADDDHTTNGNLNDIPDTHPFYQDRAYGGAGRDVLIGNTGGDRLIDWVGEYNSYLVPYAPFGAASVSRTLQPFLPEFLYALSAGDGADYTRASDTGADAERNGEPEGELGLVLQKDFAWQKQTGAPADPQAGNIPGGARDVLRSAGFNDSTSDAFFVDSGVWTVVSGRYQVEPTSLGGDALSVFYVDKFIPNYFEMTATIRAVKPTGGYNANSYLVFDYKSSEDFKFAGINVSTSKLEIGYRDVTGRHVEVQSPYTGALKADTDYSVFLALNGSNATLVVNNRTVLTYTFDTVDNDGFEHFLNEGMVGLGANNARAAIDNVVVQRLAPETTYEETVDFTDETAFIGLFGTPDEGDLPAGEYILANAIDLTDMTVAPASVLNLEAVLKTAGQGGLVFDSYGPEDFKFVTLDVDANQVQIGHSTARSGVVIDAAWDVPDTLPALDGTTDYTLEITIAERSVSVILDGNGVLSHAFNSLVTDGGFGLLALDGEVVFDSFTVRTDDPAYATPGPVTPTLPELTVSDATIMEGDAASTPAKVTVTLSEASDDEVSVSYTIVNGTAEADSDYAYVSDASGTLVFAPGETSKDVDFNILGDTEFEADETFTVELSASVNATIEDGVGRVTIVNDDTDPTPPPPSAVTISIDDIAVREGRKTNGTKATVVITLSGASLDPVTVELSTQDGTAQSGEDYVADSATITFAPGETRQTYTLYVNGDTTGEADETFYVNLSNADGATIADDQAVVTIINDDKMLTAAEAAPEGVTIEDLSEASLDAIAAEALDRWAEALELGADEIAALNALEFEIVEYGGLTLGVSGEDTIYIDADAAGYGWFVDPTPWDDVEFTGGTAPAGMDLMTVVMHELGHVLGYRDLPAAQDSLMSATLEEGVRRLPDDMPALTMPDTAKSSLLHFGPPSNGIPSGWIFEHGKVIDDGDGNGWLGKVMQRFNGRLAHGTLPELIELTGGAALHNPVDGVAETAEMLVNLDMNGLDAAGGTVSGHGSTWLEDFLLDGTGKANPNKKLKIVL
jgi:Ca2+-binding RTX toxin-like protein